MTVYYCSENSGLDIITVRNVNYALILPKDMPCYFGQIWARCSCRVKNCGDNLAGLIPCFLLFLHQQPQVQKKCPSLWYLNLLWKTCSKEWSIMFRTNTKELNPRETASVLWSRITETLHQSSLSILPLRYSIQCKEVVILTGADQSLSKSISINFFLLWRWLIYIMMY